MNAAIVPFRAVCRLHQCPVSCFVRSSIGISNSGRCAKAAEKSSEMANLKKTVVENVENPELDAFVWRFHEPTPRNTPEHSHAKGQVFSLESGMAIVETAAGKWMLRPNRCGWIPPECRHSLRSCGNITGWSIYLGPALCHQLQIRPAILPLTPLLEQIVLRISSWRDNPPPASFRRNLLIVLCEEMQAATELPLHLPMPADPRLKRLVAELSQRPDDGRPLRNWARSIGMSERSLVRIFQQETGVPIGQWRNQLRMLIALEKLSDGMSVTNTCFAVGYDSVSGFIKAFKRALGVTPLEYTRSRR